MVALPAVPKVIRYDFFSTYGGSVRDRLFFQYSGTLSAADLATLLATASAGWNTNMSPVLSTQYTLNSIQGTDLTSNTAPQAVNSTARVGGAAGAAIQSGVAVVVKFKTARRYRGGHPRFYLTGVLGSNFATANTLSGAGQTALAAAASNLVAAIIASPPAAVGTLVQVNISYFLGFTNKTFPSGRIRPVPTPRATPLVDLIVTPGGISVNPKAASQRRRNVQST